MNPTSLLTALRTIHVASDPPASAIAASNASRIALPVKTSWRGSGSPISLDGKRFDISRLVAVGSRRARAPHSPDRSSPATRHRGLDRPHSLRRVFGRPGVEALVRELLDPGLPGVRGEPAHPPRLRQRRAGP